MGGQLQRREPVEHTMLLLDVEVLRRFNACGWLGYFLSLTAYDEEVAAYFTRTFYEGEASVWSLIVIAIEECIAEVTGFPALGEHYPRTHDARSTRAQFTRLVDPQMDITKQGCKRLSLSPPYYELAMHIIRYFIYEGIFSYYMHIISN